MTLQEFAGKVDFLNRLDFKFWCLLAVFVSYGLMFFFPEQQTGKLLILPPMLFLLEELINGKKFVCPKCKTPFKLRLAPLVTATGHCYCCGNKLFDLPPSSAPVFDRDGFIMFHRRKLPWKTIFAALFTAVVINFCGMTMAFSEMSRLHPLIADMALFLLSLRIRVVGLVFLFFALLYAVLRILPSFHRFMSCPHCGGKLGGTLAQIAIGSSRCGHCGKQLLFPGASPMGKAFCHASKSDRFPAEFHWFIQAWIAVAVLACWLIVSENGNVLLPLAISAADLLILFYLALPPRCDHRRIDRIIQRTGNCGVCGKNMTLDRKLFFIPESSGIFIPACDRGNNRKVLWVVLFFLLLFSGIIAVNVLRKGGGFRALIVLIYPGIYLALLARASWKIRPVYGIGLENAGITIMSRRNIRINRADMLSVEKYTFSERSRSTSATAYNIKTVSGNYVLRDTNFAEPEKFRTHMAHFVTEDLDAKEA